LRFWPWSGLSGSRAPVARAAEIFPELQLPEFLPCPCPELHQAINGIFSAINGIYRDTGPARLAF